MTSYTGLYVQRLSTGQIHGVQVVDTAGSDYSIDPQTYISRGVQPPIEELPDLDMHLAARHGAAPVILDLACLVRGRHISDQALRQVVQHGFMQPSAMGQLQITEYGKQTLRNNGLL